MVKIMDCPCCTQGKLKIDIANGFEIIFDGYLSKLPLKKRCKCCGTDVKYLVVKKEDYEKTLVWVQTK
jgi:hypothetical protein